MQPRKCFCGGADVVKFAEGSIACAVVAWCRRSAGVEERGMYARVVQEPGRSRVLHREQRGAGAAIKAVQAHGHGALPVGAKRARPVVPPSEGNEVKRDGRREVRVSHCTDEAGEPIQGTPWREGEAETWNR